MASSSLTAHPPNALSRFQPAPSTAFPDRACEKYLADPFAVRPRTRSVTAPAHLDGPSCRSIFSSTPHVPRTVSLHSFRWGTAVSKKVLASIWPWPFEPRASIECTPEHGAAARLLRGHHTRDFPPALRRGEARRHARGRRRLARPLRLLVNHRWADFARSMAASSRSVRAGSLSTNAVSVDFPPRRAGWVVPGGLAARAVSTTYLARCDAVAATMCGYRPEDNLRKTVRRPEERAVDSDEERVRVALLRPHRRRSAAGVGGFLRVLRLQPVFKVLRARKRRRGSPCTPARRRCGEERGHRGGVAQRGRAWCRGWGDGVSHLSGRAVVADGCRDTVRSPVSSKLHVSMVVRRAELVMPAL